MEEGIKTLEEFCKQYDYGFYGIIKKEIIKLLENLIKGYKGKSKSLDKTLQENAELRLEMNKKDNEINKLNKVIDRMAISIANNNDIEFEVCEGVYEKYNECDGYARETHKCCEYCIKKYFREEVENDNSSSD